MHIITFYSYKGGVGRTMALLNVGISLSKRGRRVLLVDFDLEAPGLPTYEALNCSRESLGIVDYINEYINQNASPQVSKYIAECDVNGNNIWLMPAGMLSDGGYGDRLNQIDWEHLYSENHGYLMFEDLKLQWSSFNGVGFDYVLIDSRTGYTDVAGICTRQLPNVVVLMFLPNDQNIFGLKAIVEDIRSSVDQSRKIKTVFCPSNVPDLDDERGILSRQLESARRELGYHDNVTIIHHYDSLDILRQIPFVSERPGSRLSKEYEELVTALVAGNPGDREGALISLRSLLADISTLSSAGDSERTMEAFDNIEIISKFHRNDPEVAFYLGRVYSVLGSVDEELDSLDVAIEGGFSEDESRVRRARLYQAMGRRDDAARDLLIVLRSPNADPYQIPPALSALKVVRIRTVAEAAMNAPALLEADIGTLRRVTQVIRGTPGGLEAIKSILSNGLSRLSSSDDKDSARAELALVEISLGEFDVAVSTLAANRDDIILSGDIAKIFNFGMAEWGLTRNPPRDLFLRVLELGDTSGLVDANFLQCMALAAYVIGNYERGDFNIAQARRSLGSSPPKVFSCWVYDEVTRSIMLSHLDNMESQSRTGELNPPVLRRNV